MQCISTTPILRSFDEAKAKEFYVEFLGFTLDWEHRFDDGLPLYFQVSRDSCELHISEHYGDCSPGAAIRIQLEGVEEYHQALTEKQYKFARPRVQMMPWGTKEMSLHDPFGNRIIFVECVTHKKSSV
ncbi:MAG: glyoxalase superfamily protein [Pseudomonadota bacterium]|nr:glyoxalase superfamily protein [Pseudomonadota bacterium]